MATALSRVAVLALSVSAWCLSAAPVRVLFPANLHLTREIRDPLSAGVVVIEEYCSGNRMVSVSGERTVIVDYDKQEITEIDRRAGTYSITQFAEIAAVKPAASKAARGRKVAVDIDRSVALSREAVEVLIGAAYPNAAREEHDAVLRAAAGAEGIATNTVATYGLPVTQTFTYADSGSEITFTSTITRVGAETVPAEALMIPPAAKRVEAPAVALRRQLRELDQPK